MRIFNVIMGDIADKFLDFLFQALDHHGGDPDILHRWKKEIEDGVVGEVSLAIMYQYFKLFEDSIFEGCYPIKGVEIEEFAYNKFCQELFHERSKIPKEKSKRLSRQEILEVTCACFCYIDRWALKNLKFPGTCFKRHAIRVYTLETKERIKGLKKDDILEYSGKDLPRNIIEYGWMKKPLVNDAEKEIIVQDVPFNRICAIFFDTERIAFMPAGISFMTIPQSEKAFEKIKNDFFRRLEIDGNYIEILNEFGITTFVKKWDMEKERLKRKLNCSSTKRKTQLQARVNAIDEMMEYASDLEAYGYKEDEINYLVRYRLMIRKKNIIKLWPKIMTFNSKEQLVDENGKLLGHTLYPQENAIMQCLENFKEAENGSTIIAFEEYFQKNSGIFKFSQAISMEFLSNVELPGIDFKNKTIKLYTVVSKDEVVGLKRSDTQKYEMRCLRRKKFELMEFASIIEKTPTSEEAVIVREVPFHCVESIFEDGGIRFSAKGIPFKYPLNP